MSEELTRARIRGIEMQTLESLRTRLTGHRCENGKCVLGLLHAGPCWLPDTDAALDKYNELMKKAKALI